MPPATRNTIRFALFGTVFGLVCLLSSCTELRTPEPNPYLAETQPPPVQEFRWSNGAMPNSLDPARASSAPETDIVRAMYEGLTMIDPVTLEAVPAVADSWKASDDGLEWRFQLRETAKWSNGRAVTAADFVRSWQRLYELGGQAAHRNLLNNFAVASGGTSKTADSQAEDFEEEALAEEDSGAQTASPTPAPEKTPSAKKEILAVSADGDRDLIVRLKRPDKDFPKLVSHPIFMPVFGSPQESRKPSAKTIGNGAFRISEMAASEIILERNKYYWNSDNVQVERLRFIPVSNPDDALEAYRSGDVDALTNTEISPLAQKVFSTATDFRKNVFGALNFYEINFRKAPFNDRRVREALAISIEREQLLTGDGETTLQVALSLLPFGSGEEKKFLQDKDRARELLEQAGFPEGKGFAPIRLTVNRNETQLRVARAVARMWKENLNIETVLDVRENAELAVVRQSGQFDILRRGVVFPVPDELACISAIHGGDSADPLAASEIGVASTSNANSNVANAGATPEAAPPSSSAEPVMSESDALYQMHVIPLYFPRSFALVKPYVRGFELNSFDAPNLGETSIDTGWQPVTR
jgi:oligopeptide transport system substrate-binding protein